MRVLRKRVKSLLCYLCITTLLFSNLYVVPVDATEQSLTEVLDSSLETDSSVVTSTETIEEESNSLIENLSTEEEIVSTSETEVSTDTVVEESEVSTNSTEDELVMYTLSIVDSVTEDVFKVETKDTYDLSTYTVQTHEGVHF